MQERDREVVRAQFDVYRAWYQEGGLPALMRQFSERHDSGRELFFVRVVGPQRTGLFVSFPPRFEAFDLGELERMTPNEAFGWLTVPSRSRSGWWLVATERLPDGDWLQVGKTMDAQGALFAQFRDVSLWVMLVALALGIAGGAWLTRRTLSPIRKLIGAVRQVIATGHMDERMPEPKAHDELGELTRLFNVMLEKNGALINGMREALDNVAHDLRTPLARFRSTAEAALEGPEDVAVYRDALLDSMEESERLLTMLNTLMDISEAETGLMQLDRQRFPLAPLVAEIVELFELVAEDKGITQTTEVPAELVCFADRNRLRQVLANLLDNALKYTPSGGNVKISAHAGVDGVVIVCQDSGIGIFAEDVAKIWDRLYRADKSRSQRGLGLGLSLVRAFMNAHGGRAEVQSTPGQGSTFILYLPSAPDAAQLISPPGPEPVRGMTRSICARATQPERPSAVRTNTKLRSAFFAVTISPSTRGKTCSALSAGAMSAVTWEFSTTARLSSGQRSQSAVVEISTATAHAALSTLAGWRKRLGSSRPTDVAPQTNASAREPLQAHSFIVSMRAADCHQAGVGAARPAVSRTALRFAQWRDRAERAVARARRRGLPDQACLRVPTRCHG